VREGKRECAVSCDPPVHRAWIRLHDAHVVAAGDQVIEQRMNSADHDRRVQASDVRGGSTTSGYTGERCLARIEHTGRQREGVQNMFAASVRRRVGRSLMRLNRVVPDHGERGDDSHCKSAHQPPRNPCPHERSVDELIGHLKPWWAGLGFDQWRLTGSRR
jgi:hypothetical protein